MSHVQPWTTIGGTVRGRREAMGSPRTSSGVGSGAVVTGAAATACAACTASACTACAACAACATYLNLSFCRGVEKVANRTGFWVIAQDARCFPSARL
jgi:hypothetical protein